MMTRKATFIISPVVVSSRCIVGERPALMYMIVDFFFFKQKTAYEMRISDWSSDVCSSDLLEDRPSAPTRVWNRIGDDIQDQIVEMALDYSELSPRELAVRFTDEKRYFVSEATVYRLLKAHDLITSPASVVIKAAYQFHTKTTRPRSEEHKSDL